MKKESGVLLKNYTTLKIGGIAENFYSVENLNDIKQLFSEIQQDYHILANGSNLLINDKKTYKNVIFMNNYEKFINIEDDLIFVSSSVKIQELINFINKNNMGGIEYLYSVPATIGGAIYMNAGRGKEFNQSISDYLLNVTVYNGKEVVTLTKEQCKFSYRNSIFREHNWIILEAVFKFPYMEIEETSKLKKDRINFSKKHLDPQKSSAGTTFRISNAKIMNCFKKLSLGWKDGVSYSSKTANWLNNNGKGTYRQAKFLINLAIIAHKIMLKDIKLEYIEWK